MQVTVIITLIILCTMHGCAKKFVDEFFWLLYDFIPLAGKKLLHNMYDAKTYTTNVGHIYKNVYMCGKSCVLFKEVFETTSICLECGGG